MIFASSGKFRIVRCIHDAVGVFTHLGSVLLKFWEVRGEHQRFGFDQSTHNAARWGYPRTRI